MSYSTLLSYYEKNNIDPVPIDLSGAKEWRSHLEKRRNLYELHLGIPLKFLQGRKVLEFGCNTGENALVLAHFGARLTLVEPNQAQHTALLSRFQKFELEKQIDVLSSSTIEDFKSDDIYDLVVCENFINCLKSRDEILKKICELVLPNGFGIISYDDGYGCLIEIVRQLLFTWACRYENIKNIHSEESLKVASQLYLDDFSRINASRPFYAWWQDVLLNPFVAWSYLWSLPEILPIIENAECELYSESPKWVTSDYYNWYKNVVDRTTRHRAIIESWKNNFSYFLTGIHIGNERLIPATDDVIDAVGGFMETVEEYTSRPECPITSVTYPEALYQYLELHMDERVSSFNGELKFLIEKLSTANLDEVIHCYHDTDYLRNLWGTPLQYICFRKNSMS